MKRFILLFLFLSLSLLMSYSQNLFDCRTDSVLDLSNKIEYRLLNDSAYVISVSINGIKTYKRYSYLNTVEICRFVPKFVLKFEDSFIFVSGTGQHYRLLTVFQQINDTIEVHEFENELMLNADADESERMLFFYKDKPIALFLGGNKAFVKIYNKKNINNTQNIDAITVFGRYFIVNQKNGQKYKIKTWW